ncbi:serine hydrolase [Thermus sp. FJN-A]
MKTKRLLLGMFALLGGFGGAEGLGDPMAGRLGRGAEVLLRLFTEEVREEAFAPSFLAQVPVAQVAAIVAQLKANLGAPKGVRPLEPGRYLLELERGYVPTRISLDREGRIAGLFFEPPVAKLRSLEEALEAFRALPGRVGLWVERDGKAILALGEDTPLAVASAFKLLVLAALREEVEVGRRAWDEVVFLEEAWKSLPSGLLQGWPEGSPLTLHTLASLMISVSDNTATDALIALLGRERLEALAPHHRPFLTTREAFSLAARGNRDLLGAFREGNLEAKRQVLEALAGRGLPQVADLPVDPGNWPPEADWRFSPRELCRWMGEVADLPLMGINPGVAPFAWDRVAYKGGSRPGALSLVHALFRGESRYCVAFVWNGEGVDELKAFTLYGGLLELLP